MMAKRGSAEWKANVAKGVKRALKPWNDGLNVLPSSVRDFVRRGQVAPEMRPFIADATVLIGEYTEQLGDVTAGQQVFNALFRAVVVLNALFSRALREGNVEPLLEGIGPLLSSERAAVAALGLRTAERRVPSLSKYLADCHGSSDQRRGPQA